jgi:hypothetical protein
VHGDIARHVEQAFRVVEDDPHARVDQVVGDLLRSTRRHRNCSECSNEKATSGLVDRVSTDCHSVVRVKISKKQTVI